MGILLSLCFSDSHEKESYTPPLHEFNDYDWTTIGISMNSNSDSDNDIIDYGLL